MSPQPPPAMGLRLPWSKLPGHLLSILERWLGTQVVEAINRPGGFSPGPAARLRAANGNRVFVKAVGPELNPDSPDIFRRERRVMEALPSTVPAPRLLWVHDEGEDGWIMLVFEDIEGWNPAQPWVAEELDRVLDALVDLSAALTPTPVELGSVSDVFATTICGWRRLLADSTEGLDAWCSRHLKALAVLESAAVPAIAGNTLLHMDIRADNLLLTPDCVYVVDWPGACVGASWVDVVGFAPSVAMQGGPHPEKLLRRFPPAGSADPDAITAAVASLAGYFTQRATLPPPPGLPTLREFQAAQGVVAREWLARRTGWD